MQTTTHTIPQIAHPLPGQRRVPKPEPKITAMAGMTRDEVRRLVVSLIG